MLSTFARMTDRLLSKPGKGFLDEEVMRRYGICNLMGLSKAYNRLRYVRRNRRHQHEFDRVAELLRGHDAAATWPPRVVMHDGYAIDTSGTLPGLDRLLDQAGQIVRQRGGRTHSDVQQPYFRNLFFYQDVYDYPALLDFTLSADVLATVSHYLGTVPILSKTRPPGIRFMESNQKLDPNPPGRYTASQLYHLDLHDSPLVYVIVLIEDVTFECGPWTFLPRSVSDRATAALGYRRRGRAYRVSDEQMYGVIDPAEAVEFSYPKGTVLFIDSSRCFHYGSRDSVRPRFQMMYAFTSVARTDLSMTFMRPFPYPLKEGDSRLRRMVLE